MGLTGADYPISSVHWKPAYRIIPSRYPAINLFDRVASPEDFDALYALEALTNDRIRDEIGQIELVPASERLVGQGSGPIMAAFTHVNPRGSRFSDGTFGVFYCAKEEGTAIAETIYHSSRFLSATQEQPIKLQMRLYVVQAKGKVVNLRLPQYANSALFDPDNYVHSQQMGRSLREQGYNGIVYASVRRPGGTCLSALRTSLLRNCLHAAYLEYNWNGKDIDAVYKLSQVL